VLHDSRRIPAHGSRSAARRQRRSAFEINDTKSASAGPEKAMNRPLSIPNHRRPTPPGEILLREFLEPLGITQSAFAKHIGITNARLSEIIHGKRPVTLDSALSFERAGIQRGVVDADADDGRYVRCSARSDRQRGWTDQADRPRFLVRIRYSR
jgi:addiction module HigA family antidote